MTHLRGSVGQDSVEFHVGWVQVEGAVVRPGIHGQENYILKRSQAFSRALFQYKDRRPTLVVWTVLAWKAGG